PGGSSTVVQPYGSPATCAWSAPAGGYGGYNFGISIRTAGTTVASESTNSLGFARTSCIDTTLTSDKSSLQPTGSSILLTGSATCDGAALYRFSVQPPGGPMATPQDYGAPSTFSWTASGAGGASILRVGGRSSHAPGSAASGT